MDPDDYLETVRWHRPPGDRFIGGRYSAGLGNVIDRHRPYIYRGNGEDTMPEVVLDGRKTTGPEKREKARREKAKSQRRPKPAYSLARVAAALPAPPPPPPQIDEAWRAQYLALGRQRTLGPTPGWQPPTGADVEEWLDDA